MEDLVQHWMRSIEEDEAYQAAARLPLSKGKTRHLKLVEALTPYEARIGEDMAHRGVDQATLAECLGSREAADAATEAFGLDFVMRVMHEDFDTLSEEEKSRRRSQHVLRGQVWERVLEVMLCR